LKALAEMSGLFCVLCTTLPEFGTLNINPSRVWNSGRVVMLL